MLTTSRGSRRRGFDFGCGYELRLHGLPLRWRSEITVWDPPHRFVDEQRRGPYRKWTHEHSFHDLGGATEVRDRVDYILRRCVVA